MTKPKNPPPLPDGTKLCNQCGEEYPATTDYFNVDNDKDDGLRTVCKVCRMAYEDKKEQQSLEEHIKSMDDASLELIKRMARGGSDVPHIAEVYQCLMQAFDGAGGFAAHFMNQYLSAKPGSTTRTKMLTLLAQMSAKVSESGQAQLPLELMSDQDVQNQLLLQSKKYLRITDVDGSPEALDERRREEESSRRPA
jgi:hypothetical protein